MTDDTKDSSKKEQPQLEDERLDDVAGGGIHKSADVTLKRGVINSSNPEDEPTDLTTDRSE